MGVARYRRLLAIIAATWLLAACDARGPSATDSAGGGSSGGTTPSGDLGPGDGDSVYLNIAVPGSNGNSAGGVGVPVAGTPASYPANYNDQATMYGDLSYAQQGLTTSPCTPPTDISQHVASSQQGCNYYKHAGLKPDTVVSTTTLTTASGGTVTIQRDGWGVPFISAANRSDTMYGIGYAMAQDRLWLMDILRNFGRGQLSKFLGPAPLFYQYDAALATSAGYSEAELTQMIDQLPAKFGDVGKMMLSDVDSDLAGVNAYIATLSGANIAQLPPEYAELKNGGFPPAPFTRNDIAATVTLLQSIFAAAGGSEVSNEAFLQQLDPTVTAGNLNLPVHACQMWRDLRHANDPDATRTISATFHESPAVLNETCPQTLPAGAAIWDVGSYQVYDAYDANGTNESLPSVPVPASERAAAAKKLLAQLMMGGSPLDRGSAKKALDAARATLMTASASTASIKAPKTANTIKRPPYQIALGPYDLLHKSLGNLGLPPSMSNWLAVTAEHSASGHPIGVMGPQVGYFQPHLVWEYAAHSSGGSPTDFDTRGMAIVGIPYVIIGRGTDYAWSITSNDGDIIDTRVSKICNMDGSTPSLTIVNGFPKADGYLYDLGDGKGAQCRQFYKRTDTWAATPTLASVASGGLPLPQTVNRYVLRTHYGPVFATATVNGAPVVISIQRSNFFGELDGTPMFALASTPTVHGAASFQHLINAYTGTFNWLYLDSKDVGYIVTGLFPVRDAGQSPELPSWGDGRFEWAGDQNYLQQNPSYFSQYGGDVSFPSRTVTVEHDGGPFKGGYYDYVGYLNYGQHPQIVNPPEGFMVSWNNSPAAGWWAADNRPNWGPIHRIDSEPQRFKNFIATGKKFDFANVEEISADANHVDIRGLELLPLLLQLMRTSSLSADQTTVATLMQNWVDGVASDGTTLNGGSNAWINGGKGLGAWRRSRTAGDAGKTTYDNQPAVVLMDAW
jgi:acyl-homoserine lactone acylase PvdQ